MFETKQSFTKTQKTNATENGNTFVKGAMKSTNVTTTGNGAKAYTTSGNDFVDQFSNLSRYRKPRTFNEIASDMSVLWAKNKVLTVAFVIFMRMITRVTDVFGKKTSVSQKGGELRHEPIMRMLWLHINAKETFWKNITLFIAAGSWKDIFVMLRYDYMYNGWDNRVLDWNRFGKLIMSGLSNETQSELIKKFLPSIKSSGSINTIEAQANTAIAKWLCSLIFGTKDKGKTYEQYRKLKSSGTAHQWQQFISQGKFSAIEFDKIHGRALNKLVKSKFLDTTGLRATYDAWITKPETKDVKFTGFVTELFENLPKSLTSMTTAQRETTNKQFETLVNKAKDSDNFSKLIVVRDTSGSMTSTAVGLKMTSFDVAKALALYFSEFLTGPFANSFIEFNSTAKMHTWKGSTPLEKWYNDSCSYYGSTNFQSVIDLFIKLKNQGISESDFPTGILCISDGEFNPAQLGKTNVETAKAKLVRAGFSKEYVDNFVIVLWNVPNGYYSKSTPKFETMHDVPNVFYMSGYSASIVSFLGGEIKTASDLFEEAMNQELLGLVEI